MDQPRLTDAIYDLILEAAPERRGALQALWQEYRPQFAHANDKPGFGISAGPWRLVIFTPRTMGQMWILGFAAWRAMVAYCPYVELCIEISPSSMPNAPGQAEADAVLDETLAKVEELRMIGNTDEFVWPAGIPAPSPTLPTAVDERAIVDSIKIAGAYVFLHETRHVMFANDGNRPPDEKDEEIECDRFARNFLLEKISEYSAETGYPAEAVLNKRLVGLALGAFILLTVTGKWSGSDSHPPIALRLRELIQMGGASATQSVWLYSCCLLLSMLRREGKLPEKLSFSDPPHLFEKMVGLLE